MTEPAAVSKEFPSDPFRRDVWPRIAVVTLVLYVIYACSQLDVTLGPRANGVAERGAFFRETVPA